MDNCVTWWNSLLMERWYLIITNSNTKHYVFSITQQNAKDCAQYILGLNIKSCTPIAESDVQFLKQFNII